MVKDWLDSVGKLIYVIKTILVLYFKLLLVIMWGISVGLFSTMSYNPALEPYSLGDLKLYIILLLGNICCIPWLVLWCKRLSPAFNKPKIYYRAKDWIHTKKEEAFTYKGYFSLLRYFSKSIFSNLSCYFTWLLYCCKPSIFIWDTVSYYLFNYLRIWKPSYLLMRNSAFIS